MYSNKICNAFFFIILCFAPLISADGSKLRNGYYNKSCHDLEEYVWWGVWNATKTDPRVPASLLRLFFHDCFVNGCDASVLLDGPNGEQDALPNSNSLRGFEVIDNIKAEVEQHCPPKTVSCADILALAARDAVKFALHADKDGSIKDWSKQFPEPWEVALGRLDGLTSNKSGANSNIPSSTEPVSSIINKFVAQGLSVQDMVALSGAHTIGFTRCTIIKSSRLYPSKGTTSTMDPKLLNTLKGICPNNKTSDNNTVPLDWQTRYGFDNEYYTNIRNNKGVLLSDQALGSNNLTIRWLNKYHAHPDDFLKDFKEAMKRMGNIDVITIGGKIKGEIRNICGLKNN